MNFLKYIVISVFILIANQSRAEVVKGCMIGSQAFIYNDYVGVKEYAVSQWYKPTFETYSQSSTAPFLQEWYNSNNCPNFKSVSIGSPQCAVEGITYVSGGSVRNLGNTVTYELQYPNCQDPMNLPLDDYNWAILVVAGGLGLFFITKKQLV